MRTYDPADRIRYVHVAPLAAPVPPPPAQEDCRRLPAGYPNASVPPGARPADGPAYPAMRPALVLLPGGAAAADRPAPAARALRLAAR